MFFMVRVEARGWKKADGAQGAKDSKGYVLICLAIDISMDGLGFVSVCFLEEWIRNGHIHIYLVFNV